jgi:hypothetical protein
MYTCKHYVLSELIPVTHIHIREGILWQFFDDRLLWTADQLREVYGPGQVNDYSWGGHLTLRGWRPFDCPIGAEWSGHKFGVSLDINFRDATAEEIREDIREDPEREEFKYITEIENKVSWLHVSTRNWDRATRGIRFINPY